MEAIKGLERLISIWTERNVYEATFLMKLHKCLGECVQKIIISGEDVEVMMFAWQQAKELLKRFSVSRSNLEL